MGMRQVLSSLMVRFGGWHLVGGGTSPYCLEAVGSIAVGWKRCRGGWKPPKGVNVPTTAGALSPPSNTYNQGPASIGMHDWKREAPWCWSPQIGWEPFSWREDSIAMLLTHGNTSNRLQTIQTRPSPNQASASEPDHQWRYNLHIHAMPLPPPVENTAHQQLDEVIGLLDPFVPPNWVPTHSLLWHQQPLSGRGWQELFDVLISTINTVHECHPEWEFPPLSPIPPMNGAAIVPPINNAAAAHDTTDMANNQYTRREGFI